MRNRIVEANFKWRQAQMMVDYARKQLEFAVQKWKDIEQIDPRLVFLYFSIFLIKGGFISESIFIQLLLTQPNNSSKVRIF